MRRLSPWLPRRLGPQLVVLTTLAMLLGIGGSLAASLLVTRGRYDGGVNRPGCLASVVGAMLLIFIGRHLGWH